MTVDKYAFEIIFEKESNGAGSDRWTGRIQDQQTFQSEFLINYDDATRFMKGRLPAPPFGESQGQQQSAGDPLRGFADDMGKFVNDMAPQVAAFWQRSVDTLSEQAAHLQHRMRDTADKAKGNWDQNSDKARNQMADLLSKMQQQLEHINSRLNDLETTTRKDPKDPNAS